MTHDTSMSHPFLIALQFLTAVPVRIDRPPDTVATGRSLLYYPLVGVFIGALLAGLAGLLGHAPPLLAAAVVLAVWVAATGALHLDGLADSADAWLGGLGDRARTLAIMKDPYCGPTGVVSLVLILLLKFAALTHLVPNAHWDSLVVTPVLGRTALVSLFITTPYARAQGLGSRLTDRLPRVACIIVVAVTLAAVPLAIGSAAIAPLLTTACVFLMLRGRMVRRLGGTTGDTAGALVEITEAAVLLVAALTG